MMMLMRHCAIAIIVSLALASCAHKQPTNRQVAIGIGAVVGLSVLLYLAISQCHKGANFCDNEPNQQ